MKYHLYQRWVSLGCASTLGFFMWGMTVVVSPILLLIKEDLAITFSQTGLLFSFPILMLALVAIPGGLIADRIGTKKAAGLGAVLVGVGAFMRGSSQDFFMLLLFSGIFGVGWGLGAPNLPKVVSGWFPRKYSAAATAIYTIGIILGIAMTLAITHPFILPIVGGWRGALYFWGALALLAATIWWVLAKDPPSQDAYKGNLVTLNVWRDAAIWMVGVLLFLENIVFYGVVGWFPAFMASKSATPTIGALITSITIWVGIPANLLLLLSDRLSVRKPFYWVAILGASGLCYLSTITSLTYEWYVAAGLGIVLESCWAICFIFPLDLAEGRSLGLASGIILSLGYFGGLVGPYVSGIILDVSGSYVSVMYFLGIISAISAAVCYFGMPETGRKRATVQRCSLHP